MDPRLDLFPHDPVSRVETAVLRYCQEDAGYQAFFVGPTGEAGGNIRDIPAVRTPLYSSITLPFLGIAPAAFEDNELLSQTTEVTVEVPIAFVWSFEANALTTVAGRRTRIIRHLRKILFQEPGGVLRDEEGRALSMGVTKFKAVPSPQPWPIGTLTAVYDEVRVTFKTRYDSPGHNLTEMPTGMD